MSFLGKEAFEKARFLVNDDLGGTFGSYERYIDPNGRKFKLNWGSSNEFLGLRLEGGNGRGGFEAMLDWKGMEGLYLEYDETGDLKNVHVSLATLLCVTGQYSLVKVGREMIREGQDISMGIKPWSRWIAADWIDSEGEMRQLSDRGIEEEGWGMIQFGESDEGVYEMVVGIDEQLVFLDLVYYEKEIEGEGDGEKEIMIKKECWQIEVDRMIEIERARKIKTPGKVGEFLFDEMMSVYTMSG
jgi:hypothetical protein